MQELADSFCERCGTRFTFRSSSPKGPALASARLLARGLKNFVMTDGTSLDEAMHAARIDTGQQDSIRVAEEFHKTFNFCMTCRQYACEKCWNENQGACLTCAPLWDRPAVAPQDHLIMRTPVSRLRQGGPTGSRVTDGAHDEHAQGAVEWPAVDLSNSRPPAETEEGPFEPEASSPQPDSPLARLQRQLGAQPEERPARSDPAARTEPAPPHESPQPQPHELRTPSWISHQEQVAAQELQAQSQSWKSRDDGWALWPAEDETAEREPSGDEQGPLTFAQNEVAERAPVQERPTEDRHVRDEPASPEMALTPEELQLIEAQLQQGQPRNGPSRPSRSPSTQESQLELSRTDEPPALPVASQVEAISGVDEAPVADETREPERTLNVDFGLLGSLREPIAMEQPPVDEPPRAPVIGRLLGRHARSAEERHVPPAPAPSTADAPRARASRSAKSGGPAPVDPWPRATRWIDRPIEPHDWWADSEVVESDETAAAGEIAPAEALPAAADEAAAGDGAIIQAEAAAQPSEPPAEPEPVAALPAEPEPAAAPPGQRRLFDLPPATAERWPTPRPSTPARPPAEWPASDPLDQRPAARREPVEPEPKAAEPVEPAAAWPPLGATWPARDRQPSPQPGPEDAAMSPSVLAAQRARLVESAEASVEESPLVAALWEESSQQVLDRGNVRVCRHCALPVSTHARFCRRCGTKQD